MRLLSVRQDIVDPMPGNCSSASEPSEVLPAPGMRRVVVDTQSSGIVRDLASLRRDIQMASAFLNFYLASDIENESTHSAQIDALWIAAVTMYGRAFATGKRHLARVDISNLNARDTESHHYFIDLRNKYIAHSVNGFETSVVFADITNSVVAPPAIAQVGEVHESLSRISRERAETLDRLCRHHMDLLTRQIEDLHLKIAQELKSLGHKAVYAFDSYKPATLDGTNPRSKRR